MKLFFLVLFLLTVTNGDTNRQLKIENAELKTRNTVSILLEIRDIDKNFTGDLQDIPIILYILRFYCF